MASKTGSNTASMRRGACTKLSRNNTMFPSAIPMSGTAASQPMGIAPSIWTVPRPSASRSLPVSLIRRPSSRHRPQQRLNGKRPLWNTPRNRRQNFRGSWTHTGSTSAPYWISSIVMSCTLAIRPDCCSQNGNSEKRSLTPIKTPYSASSIRASTPACTGTRSTHIAAHFSRTWWLISWQRAA